ncbi:hypothetical protein SFR_6384 [Streptomyces sp. FR-008]|nr:hypothetical protein SFR_6384 [Streptomyces sp. FR-008]
MHDAPSPRPGRRTGSGGAAIVPDPGARAGEFGGAPSGPAGRLRPPGPHVVWAHAHRSLRDPLHHAAA